MRDIQTIFNAVIDAGYYQLDWGNLQVSHYMCDCLHLAQGDEVITEAEEDMALNEIKALIHPFIGLDEYLSSLGADNNFEFRKILYQNWEASKVKYGKGAQRGL